MNWFDEAAKTTQRQLLEVLEPLRDRKRAPVGQPSPPGGNQVDVDHCECGFSVCTSVPCGVTGRAGAAQVSLLLSIPFFPFSVPK